MVRHQIAHHLQRDENRTGASRSWAKLRSKAAQIRILGTCASVAREEIHLAMAELQNWRIPCRERVSLPNLPLAEDLALNPILCLDVGLAFFFPVRFELFKK